MSGPAIKWASRQRIASPALKSVLVAVSWFANAEGIAWPSQTTLSERTGLSIRGVRRALQELEGLDVIKRAARSWGHLGRSSDLITLPVHKDVEVTKTDLKRLRAEIVATGHAGRLDRTVAENPQPAKSVVATGHAGRGIGSEQQNPSQQGNSGGLEVGNTREGTPLDRPALRVVAGGRS